jgi:hypothetical protein
VNPPFAAGLVPEVFDGVGDVGIAGGDPGLLEPLGQDTAGGPDERVALPVLAVTGLLAHEHQVGSAGALSHDGLGGPLMEITGPTLLDRLLEALERGPVRDGRSRVIAHSMADIPCP